MANPSDAAFVGAVARQIEGRMPDTSSLDGLSDVEADIMCAITVKGIVGNGGHVYWFEGMNRLRTLRAATALERVGLEPAARALRACLDAFPDGIPSSDYLSAHREELNQKFADADRTVWKADVNTALAAYIHTHGASLSTADRRLARLLEKAKQEATETFENPAGSRFTKGEQRYLEDLRRLPMSYRSRTVGWLLELAPGVGLFSYGLISGDQVFLILGFLSQLYFSLWRMFAQYRGARLLTSIRQKEAAARNTDA